MKAQVTYERTGDDLPLLMARLREEHGIRSVLSEGGPTLNSFMLAAGLVDELYPQPLAAAGGRRACAHHRGRKGAAQPGHGRADFPFGERRRAVLALEDPLHPLGA